VWVVHPGAVIRTKRPLGACDPAWSPDGRQLAVTAPDGLWVLSGTNWSAAQRLSDAKISDRPANEFDYTAFSKPRWSPDGRRIAYVATNGGATWIEVVDVASGNRMLKTEPGPDSLTWGQDSKSLIVMGRVVPIPH
jgi:TolB protein